MYPISYNGPGVIRDFRRFLSLHFRDTTPTLSDSLAQARAERGEDQSPSSTLAVNVTAAPCVVCQTIKGGRSSHATLVEIDEAVDRGCLTCRIIRDSCTQLLPFAGGMSVHAEQPGVITVGWGETASLSTTKGKSKALIFDSFCNEIDR